jgi:hypothetical protein
VRSISADSASIWCTAASAGNGALPNFSVKSRRLPTNSTASACASTCANAPRLASITPRGLSMPMTGMPLAASSAAISARPGRVMHEGPTRIIGRFACARRCISAAAVCPSSGVGSGSNASAAGVDTDVLFSSTSVGRLRCTGPGRPERARRIAFAMSVATASALAQAHAALVTGAAIAACCISWNAPCPSWSFGAWPESSTTGASAICAV